MNRKIVTIPIIRSKFDKTKSARFKGVLSIVSNEHGIIYDWRINFSFLEIDVFTTEKIITEKKKRYFYRENLFQKLNLNQEIRPTRSSNKIVRLNQEQIDIANNYFNDRQQYNSTLKNIVGILKGNNPGGEAKNPNSAEMVIDTNSNIRNFVILLDDLIMTKKVDYNSVTIGAQEISIEQFTKLNPSIKNAFEYMQSVKNLDSWSQYLLAIKQYFKKYNDVITKAEKIASRSRSIYSKLIDKNIKKYPFGLHSKDQFQKSHIYEYHDLRDKIIDAMRNNKTYKKYVEMIQDINNFIPLPESIHRKFDQYFFTYKTNGEIWPINEDGLQFIKEFVGGEYKQIPEWFLNEKRKIYIELRNKNIHF